MNSMQPLPAFQTNIRAAALAAAALVLAGCAHVPNQFREDGPATAENSGSPTARDVFARYQPDAAMIRDWPKIEIAADPGGVTHWPLYFEDPFEDKGAGRRDPNKYYIGWEDYVALPYCFARYTLNWIAVPASMIVQPPWSVMESDGELSKQALGYDHDATTHHHVEGDERVERMGPVGRPVETTQPTPTK